MVSRFGFGRAYENNVVIRLADPAVKQHLGELRAEEFYGDQRLVKAHDLKTHLTKQFQENGIQLPDILIRQYDYPENLSVSDRAEEDSGPAGTDQPRACQTGRRRYAAPTDGGAGPEPHQHQERGAGSDKLLRLRKGLALLNSIKGPHLHQRGPDGPQQARAIGTLMRRTIIALALLRC